MTDSPVVNGLTEDAQFGPGSESVPEAYGVSASATQPVTLYFRDLDFAASPDGTVHEMGVAGEGIFIGVAGSNFRVAFGTPANGQTVLDYALSNLSAGLHDVIVALDPVSGDAVLYIDDVLEARATGPGSALWSVGDGDGTYGGLDFIVIESTGDVTLLSAAPEGD